MNQENRDRLFVVARGLGALADRVVFLGGATVDFYATDPGASDVRPTLDVDCIIEIASIREMALLEHDLQMLGFAHDCSEGAPLCRWIFRDIKVDVMPTDPAILGFSNPWYAEGIRHRIPVSLGEASHCHILELPYFIATKLSALENRGLADLRTSKDLEDIVYLIRNRSSIVSEIKRSEPPVRRFIAGSVAKLRSMESINEAIGAVLDYGEPQGTRARILLTMTEIAGLQDP